MNVTKIILAAFTSVLLCVMSSCSTTEKFTISTLPGTKIYTPNNTVTHVGTTSQNGELGVTVPSEMYCGYVLLQQEGSNVKIPIGIDYKKKRHTGTKFARATGYTISSIGAGTALVSFLCMGMAASQDDEENSSIFAKTALLGAGIAGIGASFGAPADARMRQTAYDYNFGYEKVQRLNLPQLSYKLLNPNSPKGYNESSSETKTTPRKKATSSKKITPKNTEGSKVNKNRSDNAKKIVGKYVGNGKLLLGKNSIETYDDIIIQIERVDKDYVNIRIIENGEDYFDEPLVYKVSKSEGGYFKLSIDDLPDAVIKIFNNGKLEFNHKKVNIEDSIYTLDIQANKE